MGLVDMESPAQAAQMPTDQGPQNISLCLSGGGFRATIFHLGVIDYLAQSGLLDKVVSIYGVSGGAITASHVVHNWDAYRDIANFANAASKLLSTCHRGILTEITLAALFMGKKRSSVLEEKLKELLQATIPSKAPRCYAVFSSLTDASHFAVELKTQQLIRLNPSGTQVDIIGITSIKSHQAVTMSACFPLVFEPLPLDANSTGLPIATLGKEHVVADGGIIDNLAITIAHQNEARHHPTNHTIVVSDASQLFDDLSAQHQQQFTTSLSPFRTIDYLMKHNAEARLSFLASAKQGANRLLSIRLIDAINLHNHQRNEIKHQSEAAPPEIITAATKTRTSFDAFSLSETIALYRLGISISRLVLGEESRIDPKGWGSTIGLRGGRMDESWERIQANMPTFGSVDRLLESVLRHPMRALMILVATFITSAFGLGAAAQAITQKLLHLLVNH